MQQNNTDERRGEFELPQEASQSGRAGGERKQAGELDRVRRNSPAILDVRALERFLDWALRYNQRAMHAFQQQRQALLAAREVVVGPERSKEDTPQSQ